MKKRGFERFLRLHKLVRQEKTEFLRKKKLRWAEYLISYIPVFSNYSQNEEWVKQLKEEFNRSAIV
jgi:nicotinamide mononucleotide adenylyltransferase